MYKEMIQELFTMAEDKSTSNDYFANPAVDKAFDRVMDQIPCPNAKAPEWKIAFDAAYNLVALAHADGFKRGAEAAHAALGQMLTCQVEDTEGAELWASHEEYIEMETQGYLNYLETLTPKERARQEARLEQFVLSSRGAKA